MVISPHNQGSAITAITCALEIERTASAEPQFPAVRGGVHWGPVLYREGGYVGSSLNIVSRIATQARPHQIVVTAAVRIQIGEFEGVNFVPLGRWQLKGVAAAPEIYELYPRQAEDSDKVRDQFAEWRQRQARSPRRILHTAQCGGAAPRSEV